MNCVSLKKPDISLSPCSNAINHMTLLRLEKYYKDTDISQPEKLTLRACNALLGKKPKNAAISSKNSKMPGYVFSTSAFFCKTGSKLHKVKGSVCESCYALNGNYRYPAVMEGMALNSIGISFYESKEDYTVWTVALSELIRRRCILKEIKDKQGNVIAIEDNRWFRFHDSGDIQSALHMEAINQIAINNPNVKFWIPTREGKFVKDFMKTNKVASNLCIRISGHMVGKKASDFGTGLPTSTVDYKASEHKCVAPLQGGSCDGEIMNCRNCWDSSIPNVDYPQH
tara:strand:- start:1882 stop:2733 length:852 start_codon:yes stop_codon:yes gene_type:complete